MVIAVACVGCAPTPMEIRGANQWNPNSALVSAPLRADPVRPAAKSDPIGPNVAGPVIWIHPTRLNESLVVGIDRKPGGDVYTFGLDGKLRQRLRDVAFPRGIASINGFQFGKRRVDLVAVLDRSKRQVVFYAVNPNKGVLWNVTGKSKVFEGQPGAPGFPMAMALFRRGDGRVFAMVSRKVDDAGGVIYQYELKFNQGRIDLQFVRDFMPFRNIGIIENIAVDSLLNTVFIYDPVLGIRKFHADPDRKNPDMEITSFANSGWLSEVSGLTVLPFEKPGSGFILGLDANSGYSRVRRFQREGETGNPNDHRTEAVPFTFDAARPNGLDAVIQPLDDRFPEGVLAIADGSDGRIKLYSWKRVRVQNDQQARRLRKEKLKEVNRF